MTQLDPRAAALADLRSWATHQATARQQLIAAAWRAGVRNVAELSRAAGVSRDTVYDDLRRESIDPKERSTMPAVITLTRRARVRARLDQILTVSPATGWIIGSNPGPGRAGRHAEQVVDHDAARHQIDRMRLLQLLYGPDEVADAYMSWLDALLTRRAEAASALTSWSDASMDLAPIPRWGRDRYGFLCVCCGENYWQLQSKNGGGDRLCKACARGVAEVDVEQLWKPVLPAVHGHVAFRGLLPEETRDNKVAVQWNGTGPKAEYVTGDADPFFLTHNWMGMSVEESTFAGDIAAPTMTARGRTTTPGHEFEWSAAFSYDPSPETWRQSPYGFRLTSGTLISPAGVSTFDDPFEMLDTILAGAAGADTGTSRSPEVLRLHELLDASVTSLDLSPGQRGRGAIQIAHEMAPLVPALPRDEVLRLVQQYIIDHGRSADSPDPE